MNFSSFFRLLLLCVGNEVWIYNSGLDTDISKKNSSGPKDEPCGTPQARHVVEDEALPTILDLSMV